MENEQFKNMYNRFIVFYQEVLQLSFLEAKEKAYQATVDIFKSVNLTTY